MKPMRVSLLPALTLAVALGGPALAQKALAQTAPSPEQAKSLERQIHDALVTLTEGTVPIPGRPVELTPEGDHYLLRVPLGEVGKVEPADAAFTATARMLDATRWSLDDQKFPDAFKVTTTQTVPDAPDAKNPNPDGKHKETVVYQVKLGQQDAHGVFDPSFATPTTSEGTVTSVDILHTGGMAAGVTHMARVVSQSTMRPIDPTRVDLLSDANAEGYANESELPDGSVFKMTAQTVHFVGGISGLAHNKLLPLLHQTIAASKLKQDPDDPKSQAAVNAALRQMLITANALLTGARVDETASDVKFDYAGHTGGLSKVEMAFGGDAPQDMLTATMNFSVDGLVLADLPPAMAGYVPTHVSIRPTLSNFSVRDLTQMGLDATAPGSKTVPPNDIEALFTHGGINVGFDSLGVDIAGTQFAGNGKFTVTGPQTVNGQAEITAHGLDALITKAQADPMLAQGVPMIIFLKGIAHTNGDQAVWQISVANKKVLVNGVDLSAMAGAMK
jgi:hypothetical protein